MRYTHSFTFTRSFIEDFPNYIRSGGRTEEHSSGSTAIQGTKTRTVYEQTSFDGQQQPTFLTDGSFNSEYYTSETTSDNLSFTNSSVAGDATTNTVLCFEEAGGGASATQTITKTSSNWYSNTTQTASSTVPFCIDGTNTSSQSYEYTQQAYNTDSVIDGETYTEESYEGQATGTGELRTVTTSDGFYRPELTTTWDGVPYLNGIYTKTGIDPYGSDIGYTTSFTTVDATIAGATTITSSVSIERFTSQTYGPPDTGFGGGTTSTNSLGTTITHTGNGNIEVTRVSGWPVEGDLEVGTTSSTASGTAVIRYKSTFFNGFPGDSGTNSQKFGVDGEGGFEGATYGRTNIFAVLADPYPRARQTTQQRLDLLTQDGVGWNVFAVTPVFPDAFFGFGNSDNVKTRDLYTTININTSGESLSQINTADISTAFKTGNIGRGGGRIFITGSCGLPANDSSRTLSWFTSPNTPEFSTVSKLLATHATTYTSANDATLTSSATMEFLISCAEKLSSKNDYATVDASMGGPIYGISYLGQAHHDDNIDRERTVYFQPAEYSISKSQNGQVVAGDTFTNTQWYYSTIMPDGENWAMEKNDTPVFTDDTDGEPISTQYYKEWHWTWYNLPESHYSLTT